MRVIVGSFIEFGEFVKCGDAYPLAIVFGHHEIREMTEEQLNDLQEDHIVLEEYRGQVIFAKSGYELVN